MTAMEIFTGTEDGTIAKREGRKALIRSALILLAIAIVATVPGWLPGRIYGSDAPAAVAERLAVEYAAQRLKSGEIPLWNPNGGLGGPVIGDGQTGAFFPTMALHMVLPAKWAWVASAILMMWLAGLGTTLLVMKSSGQGARAFLAGIFFLSGLLLLERLDHDAMKALALLPWAMLASAAVMNRMSAARLVGLTLLLLLVFLAGNQAASAGAILACALWLIWNLLRSPREWVGFAGAILALAAALGVAGAVAAVQWLPAYDNSQYTGINAFEIRWPNRWGMGWSSLAPPLLIGLSMLCGWAAAQWRRGRVNLVLSVLLIGNAICFVVLGMIGKSGRDLPSRQAREALKWMESQNEPARLIAEGDDAVAVPNNVLGAVVNPPKRAVEWLRAVQQLSGGETYLPYREHPALRLLGVKHLLTDRKIEPATRPATAPAPIRRLFGGGPAATPMPRMEWKAVWPATQPSSGVMVYENAAQPLPRFWIARNALWSDKAQEILDRLKNSVEQADFDPRDLVLLDREAESAAEFGLLRRPPPARGTGRLELLEDSPERVRIATEGAGGWLVLADAYAPGWTAKMSYTAVSRGPRRGSARERTYERELAIVPAYGALRAVPLAGGAEIIFEYEPAGWKNALMVAGMGGIVLLLMIGGMMFPSRDAHVSEKVE